MLAARERCRRLAHVELIAFPQEGIVCDEGTDDRMVKAIERGADIVGGMPFAEMIDADCRRHTDLVFEIARRFDRDIQMHVDETDDPGANDPPLLRGQGAPRRAGPAASPPITSPRSPPTTARYAAQVIGLVARARMSVVTLPKQAHARRRPRPRAPAPRHHAGQGAPRRRGERAYGQDVIQDGFLPVFGTGDPLQVGLLLAFAAQFSTRADIETLYDMATVNGARLMRLEVRRARGGPRAPTSSSSTRPSVQEGVSHPAGACGRHPRRPGRGAERPHRQRLA